MTPLETFSDIFEVLDEAPCDAEFATHGSALAWRHRANRARKALRDHLALTQTPSPYDGWMLSVKKGSPVVEISTPTKPTITRKEPTND